MALADEFLRAFLVAYSNVYTLLPSDEWQRLWTARYSSGGQNWNHVMIQTPAVHPGGTVIQRTAEAMHLRLWPTEPLHLDGAMAPEPSGEWRLASSIPVPLLVAIEHENDVTTFGEEVVKLFYVRCPLKVGITYALFEDRRGAPRTTELESTIRDLAVRVAATLDELTNEDPKTTYLYLLGSEDTRYRLTWRALSFTAADGPRSAIWRAA